MKRSTVNLCDDYILQCGNLRHQYKGFESKGHADYAEDGDDIVCAAVSALTFNAVNSIEKFTEDAFQVEQAEDGGYLKVHVSGRTFPKGLHC